MRAGAAGGPARHCEGQSQNTPPQYELSALESKLSGYLSGIDEITGMAQDLPVAKWPQYVVAT